MMKVLRIKGKARTIVGRILVLALLSGTLMLGALPAQAEGGHGAGVTTGVATIGGAGIPTGTGAIVTYTITSTVIGEVSVQIAPPTGTAFITFVGDFPVNGVATSTAPENTKGGTGSVTVTIPTTTELGKTISSGPLAGVYLRLGALVQIELNGPITVSTVNPTSTATGGFSILASKVLVPGPGEGVTSNITAATFAGEATALQFP